MYTPLLYLIKSYILQSYCACTPNLDFDLVSTTVKAPLDFSDPP
jgi:hypothetical protein